MLGRNPLDPGTCIGRITGKDACVIGMLGIVNGCCNPVITGGAIYNCNACVAILPATRDVLGYSASKIQATYNSTIMCK